MAAIKPGFARRAGADIVKPMDAIIMSIGNELTLGQTVDTNTAWLSRQLAQIGIPVRLHVTIADEIEPIRQQIENACSQADVVLISGGIGPTEDDLTRHALAEAMGVPLELHPECLRAIEAFFAARDRKMPEANTIQAMIPRNAEPIENTCGTAPGIHARWKRALVFVMPGVPREMKVMYERSVLPILLPLAGEAVIFARTLYCYGAGESEIGEAIKDLMQRGRNPAVGTTAQQTVIGVRIHAHGCTRLGATALLEATAAEVRRRLGTLVFGEDDPALQSVVAGLLIRTGLTVSTAESCTGGLLAKCLTDVPGSSAYFLEGVVTYSNAAKTRLLSVPSDLIERHGAVSAEVAGVMAENCRRLSGTDLSISVTGIAGPGGGSASKPVGLVYIGLADTNTSQVTAHKLGESLTREEMRDRTCKVALNRLRLRLLELTRA